MNFDNLYLVKELVSENYLKQVNPGGPMETYPFTCYQQSKRLL